MIHIYYGFGKGKTTAALGLGMRAKGAGKSVCLVRFLKDCNSSELNSLPFDILETPEHIPFNPDKSYMNWIEKAIEYINSSNADIIILDEFLDVIPNFISEDKAKRIISKNSEVIITGHKKIERLFEIADYITHMEKVKHPYDRGVKARLGIEF